MFIEHQYRNTQEVKKHSENEKQNEVMILEMFFKEKQEPIDNKIQKLYNPKTIKQIARKKIKINDEELKKKATKMINPNYFNDENLKNLKKVSKLI